MNKKLVAGTLVAAVVASSGVIASAWNDPLANGADQFEKTQIHADKVNQIYFEAEEGTYEDLTAQFNETIPNVSIYISLEDVDWNLVELDESNHAPGENTPGIDAGLKTSLASHLVDSKKFSFKSDKGDDDRKIIKKISVVEKDLGSGRKPFIKIDINDDYTNKEFKITPSFTFTSKVFLDGRSGSLREVEKASDVSASTTGGFGGVYKGTKYIIESKALQMGPGTAGAIYFQNELIKNNSDNDWVAGQGGVVVRPAKNEDNTVTWEDENRTIARLEFFADSSTTYSFPKLSTKWDNTDYAELFAEQDAYIFDFVGTPKIGATARPTLQIYNPYYDEENEELRVDPSDVTIYVVSASGELIDTTKEWTAKTNDDGDEVFETKTNTRTLGTYIFVEKAIHEEAAEEPAVPEVTAPEPVKPNPGTGR